MFRHDTRPAIVVVGLLVMATIGMLHAQTPIGGGHRLAWTQAATAAELNTFTWAIYIDGTRGPLSSVVCVADAAPNSSTCQVPFPAMTPGQHAIEILAIQTAGGQAFESARSAPLGVQFILVATPGNLRVIGPGQPVP